jgi:Holliday junction resolvasome RuvABC endonuclease subunit
MHFSVKKALMGRGRKSKDNITMNLKQTLKISVFWDVVPCSLV